MKWILVLAFVILVFSACDRLEKGLDGLFPGPGFEKGWSWHRKPVHYLPDNLYEYIDGEAELYLSYGFQEMATLRYFWGNPDDTSFVVDVFDMGDSLNAFGLYSSYRNPDYEFLDLGTEAFISDFGLKFFQGRNVVELKSVVAGPKVRNAMITVARQLAGRIPQKAVFPSLLTLLPLEGQVGKTLQYIPRDMLNQAFLPRGLEAKYRIGNREVSAFVVFFSDSVQAKAGFEQLLTFYRDTEGAEGRKDVLVSGRISLETRYHGTVTLERLSSELFGVFDMASAGEGISLMNSIRNTLLRKP